MEIKLDITDVTVDEWGTTLSELIKSEVQDAMRREIRAQIKADKKRIQAETAKVVKKVLADLHKANLENIVRDTVATL